MRKLVRFWLTLPGYFSDLQIPNLNCTAPFHGGEAASIRAEDNAVEHAISEHLISPGECRYFYTCKDVPDLDKTAVANSGELATVPTECNATNPVWMAPKR